MRIGVCLCVVWGVGVGCGKRRVGGSVAWVSGGGGVR